MTGKELIDLIEKANMLDKDLCEDTDERKISFSIAEYRNPFDENDVTYVEYQIDIIEGTGRYITWSLKD